MIVWLASFPRSGNTLLRTLLFRTLGLRSASDEPTPPTELSAVLCDKAGHQKISGDWQNYYQSARQSAEVFLIKTHRPPRDDQPAIYVVRDGRSVYRSYSHFHRTFTPPPYPSLLDLVLGDDYYGGWSEHYRVWAARKNTLLIRYEELVNASDDLLKKIAVMVHHTGARSRWENPFSELQKIDSRFFREGATVWKGDPVWTPLIDALFFHVHGDAMIELGYADTEVVARARRALTGEYRELADAARRLLAEKRALNTICAERQVVIDELKLACDERLALIERLSRDRR